MTPPLVEPKDVLNAEQRAQIDQFLKRPMEYPSEFKSWLPDYLAQNIPFIPASQLLGYKGTLGRYDFVADFDEVDSAWGPERTFIDLPAAGPSITGLADGVYWGAWGMYNRGTHNGGATNRMGLSVNGATPSSYCQSITLDTGKTVWRANQFAVTGGNDNNTITAKYYYDLNGGATGQFERRWMVILRIT